MNPIYLLTASVAVIGGNSLMLSPIAQDVATSFPGRTAPDVMLAAAAYGAATAASALVLAPLADRVGPGRAMVAALGALVLGLAVSAAAPTLPILCAGQAIAGLAAGVGLPSIYGLSAEFAPKGREAETLGKVLTGWTLSLVAGVSLSAVLSDLLHWRVVFAGLSLIALAIGLAVRFGKTGAIGRTSTIKPGPLPSPLTALTIPGVTPALCSVAAYMIAFYGLYAYLGTHLTTTLGLTTSAAGAASLIYGVGFGLAVLLDKWIDRVGSSRAGPASFLLLAAVYGALSIGHGSAIAILSLCFLWGAANHLGLNLLVGRLTAIDTTRRSTILGINSAVTYAAMLAGTAGFKPVYEGWGFMACAALSTLCIAPALYAAVRGTRRHAKSPDAAL